MSTKIPSRGRIIRRRKAAPDAQAPSDGPPRADRAQGSEAAPTPDDRPRTRSDEPAPAPRVKLDGQALLDEMADMGADAFAAMMGAGAPARLKPGERVEGRVVRVHGGVGFVDLGGKAEALLSLDDWGGGRLPRQGEMVRAFVASVGDEGVRLTRSLAGYGAWEALETAKESGEAIQGVVKARNPGGFTVQLGSVKAFCPVSQIDRLPDADLDRYVGRTLDFRVIELRDRDVVVSHRAIAEESVAEQAAELWERLREGDVVDGVIAAVKDFGAFVDVQGVRGLIPGRELGWGREAEAPAPGTAVRVVVLSVDPTAERLTLSLKLPGEGPWSRVGRDFVIGGDYSGAVRKVTEFGAFVALAPGLEGLVHISEMSKDRVEHPSQVVKAGDTVIVRVLDIDGDRQRLKLSLKRAGDELGASAAPVPRDTGKLGTLGDLFGGLKLKG